MLWRLKYLLFAAAALVTVWTGYSTYFYFITSAQPTCTVNGIVQGNTYGGDVQCTIDACHAYKIAEISLWVDNKPLAEHFKISRSRCSHAFMLTTQALSNGPHTLKVQLVDGSYHRNSIMHEIPFNVDNVALQAALVKPTGESKVFQGRTLHIQIQVNKEIKQALVRTLSRTCECFPESAGSTIYECFVPVTCEEAPNEYLYSVEITDHVGRTVTLENKFQVIMFPFKKQMLNVRAAEQEAHINAEGKEFEDALMEIIKKSPHQKLWRGPFYVPVDMKGITTEFGTVRTTQQKGRYAHKALDLTATPKTVVWAPGDGIIALKHDYQHNSGKTVVIDHGYGLITILFHLDNFADIEVGSAIKRGRPVGTVGKSGYATGYHLHWGMQIGDIPVEPMQWTKLNF
jgi:hypothetical protein